MRYRSPENKAIIIISEVEKNVWPAIAAGKVKPMIVKYFPLSEAAEAHRLTESSKHIGKILLLPLIDAHAVVFLFSLYVLAEGKQGKTRKHFHKTSRSSRTKHNVKNHKTERRH